MSTEKQWVTEYFLSQGSGFALAIKEKIHQEQSTYQKIEVYDTETFGRLLLLDGCMMLTDRDNFLYHEMMTHPALFTHPDPQKVVIIGGGDCGALKEVLKHPSVKEAWQVEIDERVTRVCEQYFPDLCTANNDARAHFYFGDGIRWIQEVPAASVDVIIVDSTDPVGPAAGLFKVEFYQHCQRALRTGGILVQQTESPLYHSSSIIAGVHKDMQQAGFSSVQTLPFPQPIYPSGWWSATMAGKQQVLTQFRLKAIQAKTFETLYYNAEIHQAALALPEFMKKILPG